MFFGGVFSCTSSIIIGFCCGADVAAYAVDVVAVRPAGLVIAAGVHITSIVIIIIWAYISYGTSWIDNSLISTSIITWVIYLALIFFRVSAGWRGRKAAILAIIALICSAVSWIAHISLESRLVQ